MTTMQRYPFTAAIIARETPVFPEVGSTIVPPSRRRPRASASSIMDRAMRSLTLPPGFRNSSFAKIRAAPAENRESSAWGVDPIASRRSGPERTGFKTAGR